MQLSYIKCRAENILTGVGLLEESKEGKYNTELFVDKDPDAILFKERTKTPIHARVCLECGFVEFYAKDPQRLKEAQDRLAGRVTRRLLNEL